MQALSHILNIDIRAKLATDHQMDEQKKKIGFFSIDLYSLKSSREEVLDYFEKNAPGLLNIILNLFNK
jgi:hypothetical protein